VIKRLYERIPEVQASLPDGVRLVPYYEQAELVKEATGTVKRALIMGAALVLLTLAVFLGNFRTALVVALALPVSALVSVICMSYAGISANVMSLGGIAIAIGMLGDGTIVMVENIFRRLGAVSGDGEYCRAETIMSAAQEVSRPVIFSIMIIITVFLPVFTLQNVEGKMFSPMAFTLTFALLGSMMMAVAAAPALCTWLLKAGAREEPAALRRMRNAYRPALGWVVRRRKAVVIAAVAAFAASMAALPFIGTEFMPALEEGSILIGVTMAPSISLEEATAVVQKMERRIAGHEEVFEVISRIGRPEAGTHPHPVNYAEMHVSLKPRKEWRRSGDKQELISSLSGELASFPGVKLNFTQPIQNAFDELLSGTKAQIAIKLFGEDLDLLRDKAGEISAAIEGVDGLVDLSVEQSFGQPQIQVVADREACARYGVDAGSIMELVELAVGGEAVDQIYLGTRRHPINVRYGEEYRNSPEALAGLLMETESGALIPLSQVAAVRQVIGPVQVSREHNQRRWAILGNVRGRDMGSVMKEVRSIIGGKIELPPGMYVEYGGQFENQMRAMKRLMIIVPITMALVFFFLGMAFGSVRKALLIILTIPLALFGGVLGLLATGEYLSVPAAIGFIALFGISVQNSMVLVSCVSRLRSEGYGVEKAVVEGALLRLRPVLLTAATTVLGLLPLLVSRGAGSEVQRPLSVVVVFGLLSATVFTLFVVPAAYGWFEDRVVEPAACEPRNG
jgi:cobalt-zinc-cadmium resistance protein CzcA